jgi:Lung seven transmembrane receptor
VAILDAGRNSMSFFMLLVVSLGLSVVRESLGRTMVKCQALTGLHFFFGSMQLLPSTVLFISNVFRPSFIWHWHRRIDIGINIGASPFIVHCSTCVHPHWIPPVDYVCLELYVANHSKTVPS